MAAPWFKLYAKELLSDSKILQLTDDQLGKLLKLWAFQCQDGSIPADPEALAKLLRVTRKQMDKHLVWMRLFFQPMPGDPTRLFSRRLAGELKAYDVKVQKLRDNGTKGGRPPKPKAKPDGLPIAEANGNQMAPEEEREEEKERAMHPAGAAAGPRRAPRPMPKESQGAKWDEILPDQEALGWFYQLVKAWQRVRVPNMTQAAWGFARALAEGAAGGAVVAAGVRFVQEATDQHTGEIFLPNLHAWLEARGYLPYLETTPPAIREAINPIEQRHWLEGILADEEYCADPANADHVAKVKELLGAAS